MHNCRGLGIAVAFVVTTLLFFGGPGGTRPALAKSRKHRHRRSRELVVLLSGQHGIGRVESAAESRGRRTGKHKGLYRLSLGSRASPRAVAAILRRLGGVKKAEPNYACEQCEAQQSTIPALGDDPYDEDAFEDQPAFGRIRRSAAANHATGRGVAVAIVDTGVLSTHEYLAGRLSSDQFDFLDWDSVPDEESNGSDDDGDGLADEGRGHGTFSSGLVAALAPDATIMPLRILGDDGWGDSFCLADAIWYATDHGAKVINISVGLPGPSDIVRMAIQHALDHGVVVVAAAGNEGAETISFPASIKGVIAVTSVDGDDHRAHFANYHPSVALCAPGTAILGPWLGKGGKTYARWEGTSFSAPMVAAAAALVLEEHPTWSHAAVRAEILDHVQPVDDENPLYSGLLGAGRLDLAAIFGD